MLVFLKVFNLARPRATYVRPVPQTIFPAKLGEASSVWPLTLGRKIHSLMDKSVYKIGYTNDTRYTANGQR